MSYVNNNLMSNEDVIYEAKIHWFIFVPSAVLFLLGIIYSTDGAGGILFLIAIILFVRAIIAKATTELAITSKRVIAKTGLISRSTIELNHSKVESFNIDQSIFGRLFGYGTLVINGTGGGKTPISNIDAPLEFRKNAMSTIDATQS
ncbi:membrane-flanked domain protein [Psychromonas ingrahamii 37]|uniref:Membrane-flanked domain protein n=1 Tax=Psychromonas ingrahamii (strain DSM 17664 / CCUG 51855 / 37) TaxID=357804 RepID=A1SXT2_PSYIN|nr:PH domain-containing protein [Psychromonas ingrahamii]ABM04297.1 membrane-flanked domain protein [Psychromonas ingrahamii 37]